MGKQLDQKGFSLLEAALILVVLCLAGFTGWFIWHSGRSNDASPKTSAVTDFTGCEKAPGSHVFTTLPGDCVTTDGEHFTEPLPMPGNTPLLRVGTYYDSPAGVPGYSLTVAEKGGANIGGSLTFHYQDGRQNQVFTYSAVANVTSFSLTTLPVQKADVRVLLEGDDYSGITLEDCQNYLQFIGSQTSCDFSQR